MNFLSPAAFWFAAVLPVVVVLYLLKRKRQVRLVPSTLLWQRFLAENQANAPFQKLKKNWLLVLQLLLLILAILALARPFLSRDVRGGRLQVLILDASASMQSTDVAPSRFEQARTEALKWVDGLEDTSEMVIVQAGAVTELKQSKTTEKSALRRAVQNCAVSDAPTRLADAFKLAETLTRDHSDAETHLFSDGAAQDLADFESKGLRLVFHKIGRSNNNQGIIALDVKPNPENPAQRAVFAGIANYSSNSVQAELEFRFNDQLLETRPLTLNARESQPVVFVASQSPENPLGRFSLELKTRDDLAADNQASVISKLPAPVRILLVTRGNRFLEKALRAAGQVELEVATDVTTAKPQADLVVLDDITPSVWPEANTLAVHVSEPGWFNPSPTRMDAPTIVDWKHSHALMRFVNFDNVQISESLQVKPPDWAVSLVDSPQSPLILAGEVGKKRVVWVGFDLLQSSWPRRVSFPIFIANAVEWLNPLAGNPLAIRAGEAFRLGVTEGTQSAEITLPDGSRKGITLDPGSRELVFGDSSRQGVYQVRAGTNETMFAVNLLDSGESDILPRDELKIGKYGEITATTLKKASLEIWRWIACAAVLVLCWEWWFFHKRTA